MPLFRSFFLVGLVLLIFKLQLFSQVAFAPAGVYSVGHEPVEVVAADFNGDGLPDFVSANYSGDSLSVLTNDGRGAFKLASTVSTADPQCLGTADLNNDNKPDLFVGNFGPDTLSVFTNQGNGSFVFASMSPVSSHPMSLVAADVNNDGKTDVISGNYDNSSFGINSLSVRTNAGNGQIFMASNPGIDGPGYAVTAGDLNGDGFSDLISAGGGYVTVLTNAAGTGTNPIGTRFAKFPQALQNYTSYPSQNVTATDANQDGHVDLVTLKAADHQLTVLTNNGNGILSPRFQISLAPGNVPLFSPVLARDLNDDGAVDLVYGYSQGNVYSRALFVLTNDGSGSFAVASTVTAVSPNSIASADFNQDGHLDLVVANSAVSTVTVYLSVPTLRIHRSFGDLIVTWNSSWTNWALQQTTDLLTINWMTPTGISDDGTNKVFTVVRPTGESYFRLVSP